MAVVVQNVAEFGSQFGTTQGQEDGLIHGRMTIVIIGNFIDCDCDTHLSVRIELIDHVIQETDPSRNGM